MARDSKIDAQLSKVLRRLAVNLVRLRKEKEWTQERTAELGEIDLRWYQRIESGHHACTLETIARLAGLFKVDISELFRQ